MPGNTVSDLRSVTPPNLFSFFVLTKVLPLANGVKHGTTPVAEKIADLFGQDVYKRLGAAADAIPWDSDPISCPALLEFPLSADSRFKIVTDQFNIKTLQSLAETIFVNSGGYSKILPQVFSQDIINNLSYNGILLPVQQFATLLNLQLYVSVTEAYAEDLPFATSWKIMANNQAETTVVYGPSPINSSCDGKPVEGFSAFYCSAD
jgi:hypothetical protein